MSTLGLWAILARGSVHLFTRVSGIKCVFVFHFTSDVFLRVTPFSSREVFVHLIKALYITATQC